MRIPSLDSSQHDKTLLGVAFLITLGLAALYHWFVGYVAIWPDSLLYAERARHLLEEGRLALSSDTNTTFRPLYSILMALAFSVPDFMLSHKVLIAAQLALVSSAVFPIRGLLLAGEGIGRLEATVLAIILALSATTLPYATMLSCEALFIPLFVWFTYFYDKYLHDDKRCSAIWSAILLGLLLLTKEVAWAVFVAVYINTFISILNKKSAKHSVLVLNIPLLFIALWVGYSVFVLQQPFELPHWQLNNGLARFNFFKNGLVYLLYAGAPLAGLAFLISTLSKKAAAWGDGFYRFAFFTLVCVLTYTALSNVIIVDHRLDYITNRLVEPFIILPLIVLMRMQDQQRKEITSNSMLIFFCMMLFGLPYAMKMDFLTGMSYWAQSLPNPNLGIIRNVIYFLLISLPVIILWWKPRFFVMTFASITALISFSNLMQDQAVWSVNEDGNFKYVAVDAISSNQDFKNASAVYVENRCNLMNSRDMAYLFRCNDLSKLLYFVPRAYQTITAANLSKLELKDNEFILFASSENDNAAGKVVAEIGLGKLRRLEKADIDGLRTTPLIQIKAVEQLGRYINLPVNNKLQRVTLLGPGAQFHLLSSKAGCTEMHGVFANTGVDSKGIEKKIEFSMNNKSIKKTYINGMVDGEQRPDFVLQFNVKEGENTIRIDYDPPNASEGTMKASLLMFGLPSFTACGK